MDTVSGIAAWGVLEGHGLSDVTSVGQPLPDELQDCWRMKKDYGVETPTQVQVQYHLLGA